MKVTLDQKILSKKIQGISSVVPTKTSLPILSTFLMEAKKDKVYMTANDLDVSLTTIIDCEVKEDGQISVPGKKFFEIVRSLPDDAVNVDSSGEKIAFLTEHEVSFGTDDQMLIQDLNPLGDRWLSVWDPESRTMEPSVDTQNRPLMDV